MPTHSNNINRFTYYNLIDFPEEREDNAPTKSIPKSLLQDFLEVLGKEIMKEDQPKLEEIEQELQNLKKEKEINQGESGDVESSRTESSIITHSSKWGISKIRENG